MRKDTLAVIIPVYRSTRSVEILTDRIQEVMKDRCHCHIFLMDDGNEPVVREYIEEHCRREQVTIVSLEKNMGQQQAVLQGLKLAQKYDYVATMDDDLAHPPEGLVSMYEKIQEGFDLVYAIPEGGQPVSLGSYFRDVLFSRAFFCPKGKKVSSFRMMTGTVGKQVVMSAGARKGDFFYFSADALSRPRKVENVFYPKESLVTRTSGYNLRKRMQLFGGILWHYCLPRPGAPRIMVLGGSHCQLHGVERAKELGMFTVLADYTEAPVGAKVADVHVKASTFDVSACKKAAKKYGVGGIMTMGTDQPVYTAACVCKELSLPYPLSVEEALLVTNKKAMKNRMKEAGIASARWMLIDENTKTEELSKLTPPYVIKPLDSQGQRGIFKLDTPEEVLAHLPETLKFSRCREALVEEYYKSDEVTVSGYIHRGRLTVLTITDRLLYQDPVHIGVCTGHRFPSIHMDKYEEITKVSEALVSSFGLKEGPFYLQILVGEQGIYVNELACRIGGAFEDVTIPYVSGFDILDAVIKNAMGIPVDMKKYENFRCDQSEKAVAVQLMFCRSGEIGAVTALEELKELPGVADVGYNYSAGHRIPSMENATARFGHSVILGTVENIGRRVDDFYKKMSVTSPEGEEMLLRLYPKE